MTSYFGENPNYLQSANGYLKIDIEFRKAVKETFSDNDDIRIVNIAFAYVYHDEGFSTSSDVEMKQNEYIYIGSVFTIMRLLTQKDGNLFPTPIKLTKHTELLMVNRYNTYFVNNLTNSDNNGK